VPSSAAVETAVIAYESQSRGVASPRSSVRTSGRSVGRTSGTATRTAITATRVSPATAQNDPRQPRCCPIQAPAGSPITVATVSPPATMLIARPRRAAGTSAIAVLAPTAQNPA
jgi:hypothetical protein